MTNKNNFSSLENIIHLLNKLAISNNNDNVLPLKYISKLLSNLTKMFEESDYYDVNIKVGEEEEIFKAHSHVLKARSSYFETALSKHWEKRTQDCSNVILFE